MGQVRAPHASHAAGGLPSQLNAGLALTPAASASAVHATRPQPGPQRHRFAGVRGRDRRHDRWRALRQPRDRRRTNTASICTSDARRPGIGADGRRPRSLHARAQHRPDHAGRRSVVAHGITRSRGSTRGTTHRPPGGRYGGYSEHPRTQHHRAGLRQPGPCLPNAMAGDPPLRRVVTSTWEFGCAGACRHSLAERFGVPRGQRRRHPVHRGAAGWLRLLQNVGRTRRPVLELGLDGRVDHPHGRREPHLPAGHLPRETIPGAANSSNSAAAAGTPGRTDQTCGRGIASRWCRRGLAAQHGLAGLGRLVVQCDRACAGRLLCARQRKQQPPAGWRVLPGRAAACLLNLARYRPTPASSGSRTSTTWTATTQRGAAWRDGSMRKAASVTARCRRRFPAQQHLLRPGCTANFPVGLRYHRIATPEFDLVC
jgi:hypothetical protein